MQKPLFIYCYDAYCGWCYGQSPVIRSIWETYRDKMDFEVLSGGMIPEEGKKHISVMASFLQGAYQPVQEMTGVTFGSDWLWHINNPDQSDWYPSSLKPAIALCIVKDLVPEKMVPFAADLQTSLFAEGRDLTDDEAYRHLLEPYGLEATAFYEALHSETYKEKALYDFALCKQLKVTGFPAAFVQVSDTRFFQVLRGYTPLAQLQENLDTVLRDETKG